jgi:integrase
MLAARAQWEADRQAQRGGGSGCFRGQRFPLTHAVVSSGDTICLKNAYNARSRRLGHSDVSTTIIYTHVLKVAAGGTASPLDALSSLVQ